MATPAQERPGNGSALSSEATKLPGCPIDGLIPPPVHEYIHGLEKKILEMDARLARFENAMMELAKAAVEHPMVSMGMPKEMKAALRQAVAEHESKKAATEKKS